MKRYSHVNWSEVARRAIVREVLSIKAVEEIEKGGDFWK